MTGLNHLLIFELDVTLLELNGRGIASLNGEEPDPPNHSTTGNQLITTRKDRLSSPSIAYLDR